MGLKLTRSLLTGAAASLLLLINGQQARASHAMGADLSYINIAPNMYVVTYNLYRSCAGITTGTNETLTYRAPGCNATLQTVTMQRNTLQVGNPYCNSVSATCNGSDANLYEENTYTATLTLPALCPNWILSVRIGNRNPSRNLTNGAGEWLFTDALINNVATQNNSSPAWSVLPNPLIGVDRNITFSQNVTDLDGDSLVHSFVPALTDLNVPVSYSTYPGGTSPGGTLYPAGQFSGTNPIISQGPVQLDPKSGSINFKPLDYVGSAAPANQGRDKYVLAYQVEEYRKINGVDVKIGSIRRDIQVTVMDFATNQLPSVDSILFIGNNFPNNSIIKVRPGQHIAMEFKASDSNIQDIITMTSNAGIAIQGSSFSITGGARPTGAFSWTPTAAHERSYPYYFTVTVTDNACPVKAFQTYTMGVVVTSQAPLLGTAKPLSGVHFSAYPNPAAGNKVTFKVAGIKAAENAEVLIYNVAGKVVNRILVKTGEEQVQWNKKADLPAGVYFARYATTEGSQTIKLVHLQ